MEMMLQVANMLTAEDLDVLRGMAPVVMVDSAAETAAVSVVERSAPVAADALEDAVTAPEESVHTGPAAPRRACGSTAASALPRGEYERQRTRESKISTACVGREREKHDWWPVGTELVGRMNSETFTATVVENPQVKSNRSLLITSGPASGRVCMTPTRAAIEATEDYRQAHNMGRSGGITNGWEFWSPKT
ncbi:MAG TPA: hypothetical protein PKY77_24425 [Phycisphaerae bacterium]|nr:hypothetical protein [Phycisphaerae bacterium]HRY70676.1 hypothetical protein [Phycisphaerae bacterium]HSA28729.1 hypothetical protein [Phycisphaerae bacterium]